MKLFDHEQRTSINAGSRGNEGARLGRVLDSRKDFPSLSGFQGLQRFDLVLKLKQGFPPQVVGTWRRKKSES